MSIAEMRSEIAKPYQTWSWVRKIAKMSDKQVTAVYFSFKRRNLI